MLPLCSYVRIGECEGGRVCVHVVVQGDHGEDNGGRGVCTSGARGLCVYVCVLSGEAAR